LCKYLDNYDGGLKALVRDARAKKTPDRITDADRQQLALEQLRTALPFGVADLETGEEFVLLIGRKSADGQVVVVGSVEGDEALLARAMLRAQPR